jgi:hypothetical protein
MANVTNPLRRRRLIRQQRSRLRQLPQAGQVTNLLRLRRHLPVDKRRQIIHLSR